MKGIGLPMARIPLATYRLQFNEDFRFTDAAGIVPYLHDLGISDIYASPCLKARKGSRHGYDIVDHHSLNPDLGEVEEYEEMVAALKVRGMGQILDIVPNHMCVESSENAWWVDLLENGPSSTYSRFFDIDWAPTKQAMRNRVLLPILGDQYGAVLERGELRIEFAEGAFTLHYYEHSFPIIPKTYSHVLSHRLKELELKLGREDPHYQELLSIMTALEHLPHYTEREPDRVAERYREKEIIKKRLAKLCRGSRTITSFISANVRIFNGEKGNPVSFDLLDRLLREQVYRLSYWRVATEEINYRRFFDINSLGAIRVEIPEVFDATHRLVLSLIRRGAVTGLRIDHADGLYNPSEYFGRLLAVCFAHSRMGMRSGIPLDDGKVRHREKRLAALYARLRTDDPRLRPFYLVCEKILSRREQLPGSWPVFGETGYAFANDLNGIFVATENARAFDKIYRRFIRMAPIFSEIVYQKKKLVMEAAMSSEINTLGHYLDMIADVDRHTVDFTLQSLVKALVEIIAFFPVYRTYTADFAVSERDRQYIDYAVTRAKRRNPAMSAPVFDFIRDVLLLEFPGSITGGNRCIWLDFTMRFQQITGPVMAKGVEDTAFYIFNRLVSLNEVGGCPERFGLPLAAFHELNRDCGASRPHALLTTSTHDSKRSEDVRSRINVLSELPLAWREALSRWSRLNRKHKQQVEGQLAPDRNEEYLLYQTLIGTWPMEGPEDTEEPSFRQRIRDYMLKALREAKVNSSWITPNPAWEEGVIGFIDAILTRKKSEKFLGDFARFQKITANCGMFNSLSQTLIKIASPGVPDFYQGSELWDLSLVDPDNRRPVDFPRRKDALRKLVKLERTVGRETLAKELLESRRDGRIKLYLIRAALRLRARQRQLFGHGAYTPLSAEGEKADNVCAFARTWEDNCTVVVAPRFFTRLIKGPEGVPCGRDAWGGTRLHIPWGQYRNLLTGEILTAFAAEGTTYLLLADIVAIFPLALLERLPDSQAGTERVD